MGRGLCSGLTGGLVVAVVELEPGRSCRRRFLNILAELAFSPAMLPRGR